MEGARATYVPLMLRFSRDQKCFESVRVHVPSTCSGMSMTLGVASPSPRKETGIGEDLTGVRTSLTTPCTYRASLGNVLNERPCPQSHAQATSHPRHMRPLVLLLVLGPFGLAQ